MSKVKRRLLTWVAMGGIVLLFLGKMLPPNIFGDFSWALEIASLLGLLMSTTTVLIILYGHIKASTVDRRARHEREGRQQIMQSGGKNP